MFYYSSEFHARLMGLMHDNDSGKLLFLLNLRGEECGEVVDLSELDHVQPCIRFKLLR
jgi:hypothetical protein